ncbi:MULTISPECIES: hypothetical protein [Xanthomonas]|uniref:hypothetical protein n=1 Tax=Xanthomonas TaxID=338 RepID=UPI001AD980FF|nr:hypothetical protein [Xanthomonas phaseoli]MBO9766487.1 hypothetical protein [Xanthomonas phaseoli pv. dieffenbachiae]MBO9776168.1 hypothetical protein [Xanthomonas phaseoli pv. dieffenbachiae]MBO9778233.1 hypothetical protein [Xanthomonas phaseoli pv. dieffenbachiae]MBO9795378.1 hypothetical protein [Xanthomonas phaseoli pv. dieffenbachiae]MBO9801427.1 hypothetical protein [Xanthomonas phaseoli pv. dieffenbachiae]
MDLEARIERLEREAGAHRQELDILIGRTNALHQVLFQFALDRDNSTQVLMERLAQANERALAEMLQSDLPETTISEHRRVAQEFVALLNNARLGFQAPEQH